MIPLSHIILNFLTTVVLDYSFLFTLMLKNDIARSILPKSSASDQPQSDPSAPSRDSFSHPGALYSLQLSTTARRHKAAARTCSRLHRGATIHKTRPCTGLELRSWCGNYCYSHCFGAQSHIFLFKGVTVATSFVY
jgi:hypothetical protein